MYVITLSRVGATCWNTMSPVSMTPKFDAWLPCCIEEDSTTTSGGQLPVYAYVPPRTTATMITATSPSRARSFQEPSFSFSASVRVARGIVFPAKPRSSINSPRESLDIERRDAAANRIRDVVDGHGRRGFREIV